MKKLARLDLAKLLDILAERLAFAELSARVHERLVVRAAVAADPIVARAEPVLATLRDGARDRLSWIEATIRELGAHPDASLARARHGAAEVAGIRVLLEDEALPPGGSFHAALALALVDHAGWFLLLNLAAEAEDGEAEEALRAHMNGENERLHVLRTVVQALARRDFLGVTTDVTRKAA